MGKDKADKQLTLGLVNSRQRVQELEASALEFNRAKDALRESEARFRTLVESTSDILWEVDENGAYVYCSPNVTLITGYDPEELLGKTPFDFMPPEEAERVAELFKQVAAERKPFALLEHQIIHKHGGIGVIECSGMPVFDEQGQFKGYRGVDRDISERKKAEEALRQSEELYRALFDNSPLGICISDAEGNLMAYNEAMLRPGGHSREDMEGVGNIEHLYADPQERAQVHAIVREQGFLHRHEVQFKRKDGTYYHASLSLDSITFRGKPCLQAVVEDITERKQWEEALKSRVRELETLNQHLDERFTLVTSYLELQERLREANHLILEVVSQADAQIEPPSADTGN